PQSLDFPAKRFQRPTPCIPLIADELLQNGERGARSVGSDMLGDAVQSRRIRVPRPLGEETPDLYFRIDALAQAPVDFQDHLVGHVEGRIARLAGDPLNRAVLDFAFV